MKDLLLFTLLAVSLSVATGSADDSSSSKHNDTAEVLIDEVGDVKMEDPRLTEIMSRIKKAERDGKLDDLYSGDIGDEDGDNNGFGMKYVNGGDFRFTSHGMIDITKPMPKGVPKGFYKTRKAVMAHQVSVMYDSFDTSCMYDVYILLLFT